MTVMTSFCMSLDGFVARPDDSVGPLFDWHTNGDVPVRPPGYRLGFRMSAASARYWEELIATMRDGAMVCGRRIFDHTKGWGGVAPLGVPAFVVTHRPPPQDWPPTPEARFTFVHDGVESAVAQAKAAGDGTVSVAGPNIAQQCLNAQLLDEVRIDLVPVLLGNGIRYFEKMDTDIAEFDRVEVVEGTGVTHLRYRVCYR
ncbi:dihydrofolate reductase family protein [Amycolatopsis sp. NPDC059027]|uniref:dihydrofolate reductase family protein n=1 Tax=unclassified Amycolatopsis TaxID=2618356 RepID=UPI00366DDA1F